MIISLGDKCLGQIPIDFHDNCHRESRNTGNISQHNKAVYSFSGANIKIMERN